MKSNILHLTENSLTLIENEPKETSSIIEFEIRLPKDALIDNLPLKGIVIKSEAVAYNNEKKHLQEISFVDLTGPDRAILKAYIKYLEREKVIDDLHTHADFKRVMESVMECKEEIIERLAMIEFTCAKTKDIPFH